jgi:cytoskeletal protein RodZ
MSEPNQPAPAAKWNERKRDGLPDWGKAVIVVVAVVALLFLIAQCNRPSSTSTSPSSSSTTAYASPTTKTPTPPPPSNAEVSAEARRMILEAFDLPPTANFTDIRPEHEMNWATGIADVEYVGGGQLNVAMSLNRSSDADRRTAQDAAHAVMSMIRGDLVSTPMLRDVVKYVVVGDSAGHAIAATRCPDSDDECPG